MIAVATAILAATLPVVPSPVRDCNAAAMFRERAALILPALAETKNAATDAVEGGAGATEIIGSLAAAYWSELLALEKSPEWRSWRMRWIKCAARSSAIP